MKIHARALDLPLSRPFTIARGSKLTASNILVEVEHEGLVGRGEGAPNARYGQSQESALDALASFSPPEELSPYYLEEVMGRFESHHPQQSSAQCALEAALFDWVGQARKLPLCRLLAIDPGQAPPSSFTISIDEPEFLRERAKEARDWPILKLKLGGGPKDETAVESLRKWSERPFRVDVNEAWSEEEAREKLPWLEKMGCELVEQPLPAGQHDAIRRLREASSLPLVADEDAASLNAISELGGVYDGINVKLMKAGGLRRAVAMIHAARGLGLEVMLGCFVESSLGIAAASHLAPLARWADLDGAALLAEDPFVPSVVEQGRISIPQGFGLGVTPR
ncbi:MAG TPA: dipeptide epimerase [Candidatus Krumholzibacteria bacterium]|nr:dipeptide epimerase [Candidatus Krumholzibacteria bacterium]